MNEYLEKHKLKTKEDIAQHIIELKRNTYPNLELISSLCFYLFDGENLSFVSDTIPIYNMEDYFLLDLQNRKNNKEGNRDPFTYFYAIDKAKDSAEKTEDKGVLNDHVKEILKDAGTKDHGEVKPNSTRHKAPVHCGGYDKPKFPLKKLEQLIKDGKNCRNGNVCFCDGSCKEENKGWFTDKKQHNEPIFKDNPNLGEDEYPEILGGQMKRGKIITYKPIDVLEMGQILGKKEENGKLNYELDWEFIEQLAKRMSQNKGKYEPYNWTRPMNVEKLKQSLFRHVIEVMKGNYSDDGDKFGHLLAISLNGMMINYQLKNNEQ